MSLQNFLIRLRAQSNSRDLLLFSGILYFFSQMIIILVLFPIPLKEFLDLQLCFSRKYYLNLFALWQVHGLFDNYVRHLGFDFIHPLWYTAFLTGALSRSLDRIEAPAKISWLLLAPLAGGLFDVLENLTQIYFLQNPARHITQTLAEISSLFSTLKWFLIFFTVYLILINAARVYFPKNFFRRA